MFYPMREPHDEGLSDLLLTTHTNLTLPVSNTDIMPCLTCRAVVDPRIWTVF